MRARRVVFGLLAAFVLFTGAAKAQIAISNVVGNVTVGEVAAGGFVRSLVTGLGSSVATFAINAALQWFLDSAQSAVGNAQFDEWLNFQGDGGIVECLYVADFGRQIMLGNGSQYAWSHHVGGIEGAKSIYASGQRAGGVWSTGACPYNPSANGGVTEVYIKAGASRPSFADWVSGNYPGGVAHPFAPGGLNEVFRRYMDAHKAAIIAGNDPVIAFSPLPDPYDFDPTLPESQRCRLPRIWLSGSSSCGLPPSCVSPAAWNGSACVVPPCPSGQVRNPTTGVCAPPDTVCYAGEIWNGTACVPLVCPSGQVLQGGACVPVPACPVGEHRANGVCVPDLTSCPEGLSLVGGQCVPPPPADDCGIGGANSLLNLDKLGKCWFKPTKTFAERWATTRAAYTGKFPLSLGAWIPTPASVGTFDCQLVNMNITGAFGVAATGQLVVNPCATPFGIWMNSIGRNILLAAAVAGLMWSIVARGSAP